MTTSMLFVALTLGAPPVLYILFVRLCRRALKKSERLAAAVLRLRDVHNLALSLYSAWAAVSAASLLSARSSFSPHALLCEAPRPAPLLVVTWYLVCACRHPVRAMPWRLAKCGRSPRLAVQILGVVRHGAAPGRGQGALASALQPPPHDGDGGGLARRGALGAHASLHDAPRGAFE